jgi:hypothetical protein
MSWSLSAAKTVTGSSDLVCAIDFRYIGKAAATVSNRQAAVAAVMCLNQVYTGIEDSGHLDFRAAAWPQPETTLIEKILSNLPDNLRSKKDACPYRDEIIRNCYARRKIRSKIKTRVLCWEADSRHPNDPAKIAAQFQLRLRAAEKRPQIFHG